MRTQGPRRACTAGYRALAAWAWVSTVGTLASLVAVAPARAAEPPPLHPLLKGCEGDITPACASLLETRALREHPGLARRDEASLWLTATTGEPHRLDDGADGSLRQFYLGPVPGTDAALVLSWTPGQAPRYLLVGGGGSTPLTLEGPPWPAPDGRMLVTATLAGADQPGSLSLFLRVGTQWRRLVRFEPAARLGFAVRGWRSDGAAVRLDWVWRAEACGDHGATSGTTQLRDGPFGWDLFPALPASCP